MEAAEGVEVRRAETMATAGPVKPLILAADARGLVVAAAAALVGEPR